MPTVSPVKSNCEWSVPKKECKSCNCLSRYVCRECARRKCCLFCQIRPYQSMCELSSYISNTLWSRTHYIFMSFSFHFQLPISISTGHGALTTSSTFHLNNKTKPIYMTDGRTVEQVQNFNDAACWRIIGGRYIVKMYKLSVCSSW